MSVSPALTGGAFSCVINITQACYRPAYFVPDQRRISRDNAERDNAQRTPYSLTMLSSTTLPAAVVITLMAITVATDLAGSPYGW